MSEVGRERARSGRATPGGSGGGAAHGGAGRDGAGSGGAGHGDAGPGRAVFGGAERGGAGSGGAGSGSVGHGGAGYEKRDIDFRRVVIAGTILLAGCALSLVVMGWTFKYFSLREAQDQPPPSTLTGLAGRGEPPEPRLQTTPFDDVKRLRATEEAELTTYGWIDRKAGIVRIPIERAIDLVAERGLPSRPAGSAAPVGKASPSQEKRP